MTPMCNINVAIGRASRWPKGASAGRLMVAIALIS